MCANISIWSSTPMSRNRQHTVRDSKMVSLPAKVSPSQGAKAKHPAMLLAQLHDKVQRSCSSQLQLAWNNWHVKRHNELPCHSCWTIQKERNISTGWTSAVYKSRTYMEWESTFCQSILDAPKTHAAGTNWKVTRLVSLPQLLQLFSKYEVVNNW